MAEDMLREGLFAERYRIERVVGRGGMATVYAAEDIKHHRRVALKSCIGNFALRSAENDFSAKSSSRQISSIPTSCPCSTPAT